MPDQSITPQKKASVFDEIDRLQEHVRQRAYDLFRAHEGTLTDPLADWFSAEHELVWRPAVEVRQKDGQIEIRAAVAGVEPKDLDVQVSPEDIVIKAQIDHHHDETSGKVHVCEFERGHLFRSIHLPERIDPNSVKAECRNGLLQITASTQPAPARTDVPVS